jgi:uncharacterized protein YndB with AHSA1/START domain
MTSFERSLTISASPAKVFRILTDLDSAPQWMPAIQKTEWVRGDAVAPGAAWRETRRNGRRTMAAYIRVADFEQDRRLALHVDARPFGMDLCFTLAPDGKGSKVDYLCIGRGKGLMALFTGSIMKKVEKQDDDLLRRLKAYAEAKK